MNYTNKVRVSAVGFHASVLKRRVNVEEGGQVCMNISCKNVIMAGVCRQRRSRRSSACSEPSWAVMFHERVWGQVELGPVFIPVISNSSGAQDLFSCSKSLHSSQSTTKSDDCC